MAKMFCDIDCDVRTLKEVDFDVDISPAVWASLIKTVKASLLPEQSYGEDRPSEDKDFVQFREDVWYGLNILSDFIKKYVLTKRTQCFDLESLMWTLILCGEHSGNDLWTSEKSRSFSDSCVKALCSYHDCNSLSDLLLGRSSRTDGPFFKQSLLLLRPKLMYMTWRKFPGAVTTYKWLLLQIQSPHLSDYLDIVFPTALIIIDDHVVERRLTGVHCVSHIIGNVTRTDMYQRGLHKVFYEALKPLLHQRSIAEQIEPVISCLIKLLGVTERGYTRASEPGMWDLFDDTLVTIIDNMVFEDRIPLRLAYIKSLEPVLAAVGPPAIRWTSGLSTVFDEYLSRESFDTRKYALQALQTFCKLSGPRIPQSGNTLLYIVLKTLQDVSIEIEEGKHNDVDLLKLIKECIITIGQLAPTEFQAVREELEALPCIPTMKKVLTESFNEI